MAENNQPYSTFAFKQGTTEYHTVYQDWPYSSLGEQCAIQACEEFLSEVLGADYNREDWTIIPRRGEFLELGDIV